MEPVLQEIVTLKSRHPDGPLEARFSPAQGMNLLSYKKGDIEAIDQSTRPLFEERYSGLGALIGPHFHHRKQIPPVPDPSLFPHIALLQSRGVNEPFSHGIGRYAPWTVTALSENSVEATLSGKDEWKGVRLSQLEGQDFIMSYKAALHSEGLAIDFSVASEFDSVIGLHTYYALSQGRNSVVSHVCNHLFDQGNLKPIPSEWNYNKEGLLNFDLENPCDFGFLPFPDSLKASILLKTETHSLRVQYHCENEENSWQLWHPQGASFVCIEPLSAKNPRKPCLTVSRLQILISILR